MSDTKQWNTITREENIATQLKLQDLTTAVKLLIDKKNESMQKILNYQNNDFHNFQVGSGPTHNRESTDLGTGTEEEELGNTAGVKSQKSKVGSTNCA